MEPADLDAHVERIRQDGYTIVEGAIPLALCDELRDDLERLESTLSIAPGSNGFEGFATHRIYNLLVHGALYEQIPTWPEVLPIVDRVLGPGCLVSSLSSIVIGPGERAQPIHADDQIIPLAKPHVPTVCNSMWALTDFTEQNGATRIIPGSHLADHSPEYGSTHDSIPAVMAKGSVLVWHGSLWHGGGANRSSEQAVRHRHELLRRVGPSTGEPATRYPARDGASLLSPPARAVWLRHLQRADRAHRPADARRGAAR